MPHYVKRDVIHKTGSTQRVVLLSEKYRATTTHNIYRKFGKVWTCGLWDMRANRWSWPSI